MSLFSDVQQAPPDAILGLTEQFKADTNPKKVNLGVGVYQDASGKLPLLRCVEAAEKKLAEAAAAKGYLPIDGLATYDADVKDLVFGEGSGVHDRVVTVQALGGTGALKVGADFLRQVNPEAKVLISNPSWENHQALFTRAGFTVEKYAYYDAEAKGADFEGMLADLRAAAPGTVVVLHACCHNPTGYDLTADQWDQVIETVLAGDLVAFLDMAYQGFSEGLEEDGATVRKFAERVPSFFVSTSFSKSLSLYGERVGALSIVCADAEEAKRVLSQVKIVIRTNYSNPPTHGAQLAATVLSDADLRAQWVDELGEMRDRIKAMRGALVEGLKAAGVEGDYSYITDQVGMFSFSGLTKDQMVRLRNEFGVYGTDTGRICVAALNDDNVGYVSESIAAVLKG
ncbi:aspartate/tyrosine/aromatic aminotransferase [Propioniciclava sp. MC1595]|uniref:amino acid aminotransferase n=1 Tax=Propioniciclava sp. MC1595 TaxID=2760308 RepID=UPI00166241A8|nr:amino acid aminotransferase [Propioniciclava sp. MC1595]MBB1496310.1 aspartate/tyrosine/aromatic aminotransferase [Propioniciclava sp. MC1595]QTE26042.1 aspartate/tyrosine/aromatic aminotransferase [Propioniciclava sp. MC1595]